MATRQLRVEIVGDPRRIMRTFDSIERSTGKMARGISRFGTLAAAGIAGIAGGAVVAGLKSTIDAASDLNESVSKSQVVFGKSGKAVQDFAKGAAKSLGQSRQQALEAAATFGNLFVSMKLGQKPAADMSIKIVRLASDLASFNNVKPEEALEALRSGLVGETEPLRRFGINLNDADLRQRALALGLTKTTKEVLPPAIKAQAAYSLIMEQSKTAQGDFARTSQGAANQQRIFAARMQDLKATLGQALLPTFNAAIKVVNEQFIPAMERLWKEHGPAVRGAFSKVSHIVGIVWHKLKDELWPEILNGAKYLKENLGPEVDKLTKAWRDNSDAITGLKTDLKPLIDNVFPILAKLIRGTSEEIRGAISLVGWFGRAWEKVRGPVLTVVHLLVREVLAGFGQILRGAANAFGWVPNVGAKLRTAAGSFDKFQQDVNEQFRQIITGKTINLKVRGTFQPPPGMSMRDIVFRAGGGLINAGRPGNPRDDVLLGARHGEFVVNPQATARNRALLEAINAGRFAGNFAAGGVVVQPGFPSPAAMAGAGEGSALRIAEMIARNVQATARMLLAGVGGNLGRWIAQAIAITGVSPAWGPALARRARFESGGNPRAINLWDSNAQRGTPSMGLMQTIGPTFNAYAFNGLRDIWNPVHNLVAAIRYILARYGSIFAIDPPVRGYDAGGLLPPGVSMAVNRTGRPERVLGPGEGGVHVTVNIGTVLGGDARRVARELGPALMQEIREDLRRRGQPVTV